MSLLLPEGVFLEWRSEEPYVDRAACLQDGTDHRMCGVEECSVPGVPGGVLELWPERPHQKTLWSYCFRVNGKTRFEDRDVCGDVFRLKRFIARRIHALADPFPWVTIKVVVQEQNWRALLVNGKQQKRIMGQEPGERDDVLLAASLSALEALKKPCKLAFYEPSGRLRAMYDEGYWRDARGLRMEAIETLARQHYVKLLSEKDVEKARKKKGAAV